MRSKSFTWVALILICAQMILPSIVLGERQNVPHIEDAVVISVSDEDETTITWTVAIQEEALTEQRSGAIRWSDGIGLTSITDHEAVTYAEADGMYTFHVHPQEQTVYLQLITEKLTNEAHTLAVDVEVDEITMHREATVQATAIVEPEPVEDPAVEEEEPEAEETVPTTEEDANEEENEQDEPTSDEQTEEPIEDEKPTEEESPAVDGARPDEEPVFAAYPVPFITGNAAQLSAVAQTAGEWPAPGSLQLDKTGTPTDKYAEWEVELTVEGKNVQSTSDIVLVFDRSNSMLEGQRLRKAKEAAIEFVNEVLVEDSMARIALVSFGLSHRVETQLVTFENKQSIIDRINAIQPSSPGYPAADGGTNIQAGLHQAELLLGSSQADKKTIVLLSDGEPTASFKAQAATSYQWPNGKYSALLSNFNYGNYIGSGTTYTLTECSFWVPNCERYTVNGHTVTTHGLGTISEAKHIMDRGFDMYTVGLEVGNNSNANYVLQHSQNKGYYSGGSDDMSDIFDEIAAHMAHAASNAVVTDPLGAMFDLVEDGSYAGGHFEASHGTVSWDAATETFAWDIGHIREGELYTLKYKVTIDWGENPEGDVLYPLNKTTPLNYKDYEGNDQVKQFPIPEGKIEEGRIISTGYRVNPDGDPVDANGNVVDSIAQAEQLYETIFAENGSERLPFFNTYDVYPEDVADYTFLIGADPTAVDLTPTHPFEHVYFGYVKTSEMAAGTVTAIYVDTDGNPIAPAEEFSGLIGETYETEQKDIDGYTFVQIDPGGAEPTGTFTAREQEVIYIYEKNIGSVHITKIDEEDETVLAGAVFELRNVDDEVVATGETDSDGMLIFTELDWGTYFLVETKAPAGYRLLENTREITIDAEEQVIELTIENTKQEWEIPDTGGTGPIGFYLAGIFLFMSGLWLTLRRFQKR